MINSICIYCFTFLISICMASLYKKRNNKLWKTIIFSLSILLPILIATIRYNVGTDFKGYYQSYTSIKVKCNSITAILSYYQEPMHVIINLIAYKLFDAFEGFLFLSSLLIMFFAFKGILNFKDKISSIQFAYFIFLLTLYHVSFNGIRQVIASMIIFYAYKYIVNRDFKRFLLFVIFAMLFHKSAIIGLLLYFVWRDKGKKEKTFYLIVLITTIAIPIIAKIIYRISEYLNIYQKYFTHYSNATEYGFILYIIPVVAVILINNKNYLSEDKLLTFFMRIYILQIPLQILGNHIAYADRLSLYALPAQIILVPLFIKRLNKYKQLNTILFVLWYIFYYIVMFIILKSNGVYPFKTNLF